MEIFFFPALNPISEHTNKMDRPKGELVCTGTTIIVRFSLQNTKKFCRCTSKTIGSTVQMKQLCNRVIKKTMEKQKRKETSWGFGIVTISDGWIHFASFPLQSDIQIKLEHHLFATIQRQQGLETRNHDDGNSCTQILPTRSSLGPGRRGKSFLWMQSHF